MDGELCSQACMVALDVLAMLCLNLWCSIVFVLPPLLKALYRCCVGGVFPVWIESTPGWLNMKSPLVTVCTSIGCTRDVKGMMPHSPLPTSIPFTSLWISYADSDKFTSHLIPYLGHTATSIPTPRQQLSTTGSLAAVVSFFPLIGVMIYYLHPDKQFQFTNNTYNIHLI